MTSTEQLSWTRVRDRLRAEVGDDIYTSWFARMELEGTEAGTVKLSVPTRFLKSWIQSHYAEKVLTCWQAEDSGLARIELTVRSSVIRSALPRSKSEISVMPREARETEAQWQRSAPLGERRYRRTRLARRFSRSILG